ncbi:MAG: hypothetical protein IT457_11395 [Planctomycetes bacterium]|nr:hypothetical protein [Planctomycetota bacterium]
MTPPALARDTAWVCALLLAACATPPSPPAAPPSVTSVLRHFSGTALSGRRPEPDAAERLAESATLDVRCTFRFAPAALPEFAGEALAPATTMIVARRAGNPLLGVARLAAGARFGEGEPRAAAGETPLAELSAALPRGVTADFARRERAAEGAGAISDAPLGVLVSRSAEPDADRLRIALALRGKDVDGTSTLDELLTLAPELVVDGAPLWFALPTPFTPVGALPPAVILVRLEARTPPPDDAAHRAAVAACLDDLRLQGELEREALRALGEDAALARALASTTAPLASPQDLRRALVFVGERAHADVFLDLALVCDEPTLKELATRVGESVARAEGFASAAALPWTFDAIAWRLLAERLDTGRLDDAQRGFLLRRAGEVGRFPGGLTAMLTSSETAAAFDAALAAENLAFLATSDPASRVRAHDWLTGRGLAIEGYVPLAPRDERKAALERAEDARRAAAEGVDR